MIAVDTSALMAVILDETDGKACSEALLQSERLIISAATLAEALIVAERKGVSPALRVLIEGLALEVEPVTAATARNVAEAYSRWGKGQHPAALNFGDCFAYVTATSRDCPLLFTGEDFGRTDIRSAVKRP